MKYLFYIFLTLPSLALGIGAGIGIYVHGDDCGPGIMFMCGGAAFCFYKMTEFIEDNDEDFDG